MPHDLGEKYSSTKPKVTPIALAAISRGSARHGPSLAGVMVSAVNPATAATGPPNIPEATNVHTKSSNGEGPHCAPQVRR